MKNIALFIILPFVMVFSSCGAMTAVTDSHDSSSATLVADALENGNICLEVSYIVPSKGPSRASNDGYKLTVKDGKVNSNLPFFGENFAPAVYGTDPSGIKFDDYSVQIDKSKSKPGKGQYVWSFEAKSGHENVEVTITFYDNGRFQLVCIPANRSIMNYSGTLVEMPEEKK